MRAETQEEDTASGSTFARIEEILQNILFAEIEHFHPSEEPKEGFRGDGGDSDDEFFEGGVQLDIDVIDLPPPLNEMWGLVKDVLAMQSNTFLPAHCFFAFSFGLVIFDAWAVLASLPPIRGEIWERGKRDRIVVTF